MDKLVQETKAAKVITALLVAFIVVAGLWALFGHPRKAKCVGLCQCWYCAGPRVNGQCTRSVGCVGACNSCGNCGGVPGLGGCGADLLGCRGTDCCGAPPPPRPRPTPTPRPPASCHGQWRVIRPPKASVKTEPPYPVAYNQDPSGRGLDIEVQAVGGYAELWWKHPVKVGGRHWHRVCRTDRLRHYDDPIVSIDLTMRRSAQSREWMEKELSKRYYGAKYLEKLPWQERIWQGVSMSVVAGLYKYQAEDPGRHEGEAVVRSRGTPLSPPYVLRLPYRVRVWLLDETGAR